jgi:hypothetical protein
MKKALLLLIATVFVITGCGPTRTVQRTAVDQTIDLSAVGTTPTARKWPARSSTTCLAARG